MALVVEKALRFYYFQPVNCVIFAIIRSYMHTSCTYICITRQMPYVIALSLSLSLFLLLHEEVTQSQKSNREEVRFGREPDVIHYHYLYICLLLQM